MQKLLFESVTMDDGLSQVCVNAIMQDTTGFLWFGTQDGLNYYDGYTFKVYKPNLSDSTSITSNNITSIFQDSYGKIWIGTVGGGLNVFNPLSETFSHYMHDSTDEQSLGSNDVYTIFEDSDRDLWIGTYGGGLNLFNREKHNFTVYKHEEGNPYSLEANNVRAITEDDFGFIWVGLNSTNIDHVVHKFDKETGLFYPVTSTNNDVMTMKKDINGNIWVGTYYGGIDVINPQTEKYRRITYNSVSENSLSSNIVMSLCEDTVYDIMYIGTRAGGLNLYDMNAQKVIGIETIRDDEYSILGNDIISLLKDKSGVIWLGTETAGLNKYNTERKEFQFIYPSQLHDFPISSNNVFAIYEDNADGLWIGTRGAGLTYYNTKTGATKTFQSPAGDPESFNKITSLVWDQRGFFWIGTDGNGFFKFNPKTEKKEHFSYNDVEENSLSNDAVTDLYLDGRNQLWVGTWGGGLNKFVYETKTFTRYPIDEKNFMRNVVWCIYGDAGGNIWVGTGGQGLAKLNPITEEFTHYKKDRQTVSSLSNDVVYSILELQNGSFWVGTGGAGINKFDRVNKFKSYTKKSHGLTNDMVLGMLEDDDGNIWLSTYFGLSKFNPLTEKFTNFNELDGLPGNSFNERACFKGNDGTLYFGGQEGLTYFTPDDIIPDKYTAPVVITDLKIFNKSVGINEKVLGKKVLSKSIVYEDEIILSHKHNFSLEFSTLHYAAPSKNMYKYRLLGFEDKWTFTDSKRRFATYTNLSGKDYVFEVVASNNDGEWSDKVTRLKITVIPPFWKTTWFYSILLIVIALGIVLYIKIRERQLIAEKRKLERMVDERTQEINQQKEELQLQSELLVKNNDELSRTNRLIQDSISYAKRIQDAMLPTQQTIQQNLLDSFVLFKPKDIVSGDFYWFVEQNGVYYIAVADCTGHGVPGAFMSMIGTTLLNEISNEKSNQKPSVIIEKLNKGVITALNQNKDGNPDSQDDGMDITICAINPSEQSIQISCANHVVFVMHKDSVDSVEGDICSVGGLFSAEDKGYTNHEFRYKPGMCVYMFSDGYQDQFGGARNKKFMAARFKDLLFEHKDLPMNEQKEILDKTFEDWRGTHRQIDDVVVFGVKL
ncbi:MAG: SpoIIE family protein phosphatase [Bacteroidales bacterium]|nr:SpoIIE family protein phosphatase [Bacteroidales bacterium]